MRTVTGGVSCATKTKNSKEWFYNKWGWQKKKQRGGRVNTFFQYKPITARAGEIDSSGAKLNPASLNQQSNREQIKQDITTKINEIKTNEFSQDDFIAKLNEINDFLEAIPKYEVREFVKELTNILHKNQEVFNKDTNPIDKTGQYIDI